MNLHLYLNKDTFVLHFVISGTFKSIFVISYKYLTNNINAIFLGLFPPKLQFLDPQRFFISFNSLLWKWLIGGNTILISISRFLGFMVFPFTGRCSTVDMLSYRQTQFSYNEDTKIVILVFQ